LRTFGVKGAPVNSTVFLTVLSGVLTYVLGQLILKLMIEPVQELRRTIGVISHALIERANVIQNPGVPTEEVMKETSQELRKLSSQLQSHLYLVPLYGVTARIFRLPAPDKIRAASGALIGLSNSVFRASEGIYKANSERVEMICDSLGIYLAEGDRWPKD
jgi:hypothetical protein